MYTAVNGIYEDGQLILTERPPTTRKTKVVVLFLDEKPSVDPLEVSPKGVRLGSLEGKYSIPENFNDPLDDLIDYM
jgi:hypothetical protein